LSSHQHALYHADADRFANPFVTLSGQPDNHQKRITDMANAAEFIEDVRRYDAGADEATVGKIVKHLGIALQRTDSGQLTDSGMVAASDPAEMSRVRDKWAIGKLGLDEGTAALIVDKVAAEMSADRRKNRVTFYYLAAKHADKLGSL
jgi:hypothetical protein